MQSITAPAIFSPKIISRRCSCLQRLTALATSAGCTAVLALGSKLHPDPSGLGTHLQMGAAPCPFLQWTGLPCPSCGMTTSFAWFARGNFFASAFIQPMGFVLAMLSVAAIWVGLYIALTGRPALRLLKLLPGGYYIKPLIIIGVSAWAWKIFLHLDGIDGWPV